MAKKEVIVGDFGLTDQKKENPHIQTDREVRENLLLNYGVAAEAQWRYYGRSAVMPKSNKAKDKPRNDPEYVPCPAPVKIDPNGDWSAANCKRCNCTVPAQMHGRDKRDWAVLHQEMEHAEEWVDRNSNVDDENRFGHKSPPQSCTVVFPKWASSEEDAKLFEMNASERRLEKQRRKMAQSNAAKSNLKEYNARKKQEKAQKESEEKIVVGESESE